MRMTDLQGLGRFDEGTMAPNNRLEAVYRFSSFDSALCVGALLPDASYSALQQILPARSLIRVGSWDELQLLSASDSTLAVLFDPLIEADGLCRAMSIIEEFPAKPAIAYVTVCPESFRAVAKLGRVGMYCVFTHPLADKGQGLRRTIQTLTSQALTDQFLSTLERWAGQLPATVERTIIDMFDRPHLYRSLHDLAYQVNVSPRHFYRRFGPIPGGAPRKLLIAAKILRAYTCLHDLNLSVRSVSREIGYQSERALALHTVEIFGCPPAGLRTLTDREEVLRRLFEWFYKPASAAGKRTADYANGFPSPSPRRKAHA
jgi:AraC-like DNA-binding protein